MNKTNKNIQFGKLLRTARNLCQMTIVEVSEHTGIHYSIIAAVERGEVDAADHKILWSCYLKNEKPNRFEGDHRTVAGLRSQSIAVLAGNDSPLVCAIKRYPLTVEFGGRSLHWDDEEAVWVVTEEKLGGVTDMVYFGESEMLAVSNLVEGLQTGEYDV